MFSHVLCAIMCVYLLVCLFVCSDTGRRSLRRRKANMKIRMTEMDHGIVLDLPDDS
jgi:hypothetical protein